MITIDEVKLAKRDVNKFLELYKLIFFDKRGKPKLRMWLKKMRIKDDELDDVESLMVISFAIGIDEYNHDKIPFDKWMWQRFKFCLYNYFNQKHYVKKNSNLISLSDVYKPDDDEVVYNNKIIDIGYVSNNEFEINIDIEHIISTLNDIQSFICKCKIHNGWSDKEIRNFLNDHGITNDQYKKEQQILVSIIKLYLKGKI